MAQIF